MTRVRQNFFDGTLSADMSNVATSISSSALADFPVVADPDVAYLVIDPNGDAEVVKVTAHSASATTATIVRAQDDTTAVAHATGTQIIQPTIASDLTSGSFSDVVHIDAGAQTAFKIQSPTQVTPGTDHYFLEVYTGSLPAAGEKAHFYLRPGGFGDTGIQPIMEVDDTAGAPILILYTEGGLWVNDNIKFVDYDGGYIRGVEMGYLSSGTNTGPALMFGTSTNPVATVVSKSATVTLDAGRGTWIRVTDSNRLAVSRDFVPELGLTGTLDLGKSTNQWDNVWALIYNLYNTSITSYTGDPEGNKSGSVGDLCTSANGHLYRKATGTATTTGWEAVTHQGGDFGNASDGDATVTGGTTTLTRDMHYDTLTVEASGLIDTAGFRVFARQLIGSGVIKSNGGNGAATTTAGTAATTTGWYGGGGAGGAGGTAAGSTGNGFSAVRAVGASGGGGGAGSGGAGGAAGSSTAMSAAQAGAATWAAMAPTTMLLGRTLPDNATIRSFAGGAGGGGGGGDGTQGGGGGGGGGVVVVCARDASTWLGSIQANGGNGGSPPAGNRGGGGGGGGGAAALLTRYAPTGAHTITATGGTGGTLSGTGANGTNGTAGSAVTIVI